MSEFEEAEGWSLFGVALRCTRSQYNKLAKKVYSSTAYANYCVICDVLEQGTFLVHESNNWDLLVKQAKDKNACYHEVFLMVSKLAGEIE